MRAVSIAVSFGLLSSAAVASPELTYRGMCEVSAAASLDSDHFAVASDETNDIRIYRRGSPDPVGKFDKVEDATGFDKSDLEGAARIGDVVYWVSSHSFNRKGKDQPKRKLFFATRIGTGSAAPTLELVGKPRGDLRDAIATAAEVQPSELNIEGLAATETGQLLIGLRAPVKDGRATIVRLDNPEEVVRDGKPPRFGPTVRLDLGGKGIRSIERVGSGDKAFVIVAGPVKDGGSFSLRSWSGRSDDEKTVPVAGVDLAGFFPEALVAAGSELLVMSDEGDFVRPDGSKCDDEDPGSKPAFRVRMFPLPR